ncbi:MAG: stage III sporulation AC/AD family protein [Acutalibacteraceae bacterium]|nr:stage III sporulation AC/AD family protein [Acutalibacteraceae bacterium]
MIKIFTLAVVVSLVSVLLKKYSQEFLLLFRLISACVLLLIIFKEGYGYFSGFADLFQEFNYQHGMISGLLKASFIAVITKLTCDICSETGNSLLEDIVELGGRIMIFIISLPYISDILTVIFSFVD